MYLILLQILTLIGHGAWGIGHWALGRDAINRVSTIVPLRRTLHFRTQATVIIVGGAGVTADTATNLYWLG